MHLHPGDCRRSSARRASSFDGGACLAPIDMLPDDVLGRILAKVWEVNASGV